MINRYTVFYLVALTPLFLAVVFLNRYIFYEGNLPIFGIIVLIYTILKHETKITYRMILNVVTISFFIFIGYCLLRFNHSLTYIILGYTNNIYTIEVVHIWDMLIFLLLIVCSIALSYNSQKISKIVWLLIAGYVSMFIVRNLINIEATQQGSNLSSGFTIFSLMPFVLLGINENYKHKLRASYIILFILFLFFVLIGSRTATISIITFFIMLGIWPIITKHKFLYYSTFFAALLFICAFMIAYLLLMEDQHWVFAEQSNIGFLQKRIGTRFQIWQHLIEIISGDNWLYGFGVDFPTNLQEPVSYLFFDLNRENIAAESLYLELVYRTGVLGLLFFLLVLFCIWKMLWDGRHIWVVKLSGCMLISTMLICSAGTSLIFSTMQLKCGFIWLFFGLGIGAALRAKTIKPEPAHKRL